MVKFLLRKTGQRVPTRLQKATTSVHNFFRINTCRNSHCSMIEERSLFYDAKDQGGDPFFSRNKFEVLPGPLRDSRRSGRDEGQGARLSTCKARPDDELLLSTRAALTQRD